METEKTVSPEDIRAIAECVYSDKKWLIYNGALAAGEVISYDKESGPQFNDRFNPSLNGSDRECKQALDVLKYLTKGMSSLSDTRAHVILRALRDNDLTPAMRCILEAKR